MLRSIPTSSTKPACRVIQGVGFVSTTGIANRPEVFHELYGMENECIFGYKAMAARCPVQCALFDSLYFSARKRLNHRSGTSDSNCIVSRAPALGF
jgi:hypothetical protein